MYSVCDDLKGRVSPFGHLRIKARLPAPRSFSQATTSFIACNRQGIHHVHLFTCPYNVDLSFESAIEQLSSRLPYFQRDSSFRELFFNTMIDYNHYPPVFSNTLITKASVPTDKFFTSSKLLKNETAF
jgi:hypothetical protein